MKANVAVNRCCSNDSKEFGYAIIPCKDNGKQVYELVGNYLADFDSDFYVTNKYELPIVSGMKIIVKDKENGFSLKSIAVNEKNR